MPDGAAPAVAGAAFGATEGDGLDGALGGRVGRARRRRHLALGAEAAPAAQALGVGDVCRKPRGEREHDGGEGEHSIHGASLLADDT
jgi:hypothetical protein